MSNGLRFEDLELVATSPSDCDVLERVLVYDLAPQTPGLLSDLVHLGPCEVGSSGWRLTASCGCLSAREYEHRPTPWPLGVRCELDTAEVRCGGYLLPVPASCIFLACPTHAAELRRLVDDLMTVETAANSTLISDEPWTIHRPIDGRVLPTNARRGLVAWLAGNTTTTT